MFHDLVEARAALVRHAERALDHIERGNPPPKVEHMHLDCKEEPGRRGRGGVLLPAQKENTEAADYLAREVACFANTPGGGVLVLGVADRTWDVLGTELDIEWLRQRIYQLSDIAPTIEERRVAGQRLLILLVAEAAEPVEDSDGKIRWRIGDSCQPVDRSEWWYQRQASRGLDPMAAETGHTSDDATGGSLSVARQFLRDSGQLDLAEAPTDHEVLRRLGALTSTGRLTQAGALFFCAGGRTLLRVARLDVPGGEVTNTFEAPGSGSLLEQLVQVEARLDAYNPRLGSSAAFAEVPVRALPPRAVREAVLNGIVHRDWMRAEPTEVTWTDIDARLDVWSPGGFTGEVSAENVLTQRHARYPSLSDLSRALGLVDRQGVGVGRMYRELIVLGHRPPGIAEQPGPGVRTTLVGGTPIEPVVDLFRGIRPRARQEDVHIAVLVHHLLHHSHLTRQTATRVLQGTVLDAEAAVEAAEQTTVSGHPLIAAYKDTWVLGAAALSLVEASLRSSSAGVRRRLLTYRKPSPDDLRQVVREWLAEHDRVTSGDLAALSGLGAAAASRAMTALVGDVLDRGSVTVGRNAHFVARSTP